MVFGIFGNTTKPLIRKVLPPLFTWFNDRKIDFYVDSKILHYLGIQGYDINRCEGGEIGKICDVVLAFGGDGTILSTARAVAQYGVPILGVNLGGLGFLAEVSIQHLYDSINDILNNNYTIIERLALKAEVFKRQSPSVFYGLNDIVVDKSGYSRIIHVHIYINDDFLTTYLCDGVIVATPTGSTAYSLSAHGPILSPDVYGIIVNPISPHSLGVRPMVISADSEIKIMASVNDRNATLSADGQVSDCLRPDEYVIVKQADYKVKWIQYKEGTFFDVLRTKLNWGIDKRMD
ncbi:NAD(+)/NADH kinase [candidate division KSB1 bacterium]|nr:NAD(+)/NADH kinase [candidate division KSB1 bacterium]